MKTCVVLPDAVYALIAQCERIDAEAEAAARDRLVRQRPAQPITMRVTTDDGWVLWERVPFFISLGQNMTLEELAEFREAWNKALATTGPLPIIGEAQHVKVSIDVKDRRQAKAVRVAMADPATRAFVLVMGTMLQLPSQRAQARVLSYVADHLAEERENA